MLVSVKRSAEAGLPCWRWYKGLGWSERPQGHLALAALHLYFRDATTCLDKQCSACWASARSRSAAAQGLAEDIESGAVDIGWPRKRLGDFFQVRTPAASEQRMALHAAQPRLRPQVYAEAVHFGAI